MDHPQCYLRILITPLVSSNSSYLSFVNTYSLLHQINISYISVFLNVEAPCNCCWFSENILHNQVQCMIYIKLCLCPSIFFHDVYHGHVHGLYLNAKLALKTNFFPMGHAHVCEVSNLLFTSSTSKGNFTYLYLTDLDKLLQSVLQTPYTATRVKNLIELGVITRNPKTLFKDILPRKFWQFTFLHVVHFRSNVNNVNR